MGKGKKPTKKTPDGVRPIIITIKEKRSANGKKYDRGLCKHIKRYNGPPREIKKNTSPENKTIVHSHGFLEWLEINVARAEIIVVILRVITLAEDVSHQLVFFPGFFEPGVLAGLIGLLIIIFTRMSG